MWVIKTFSDLFKVKHGYAFKSKFFADEGAHVVLTPGNFHEKGGFKEQEDKRKFYTGDIPQDFILSTGDVIIAMTEQAPGLLGSSAWIPRDGHYLHNQRLGKIIDVNEEEIDLRFLYYLFNTASVRNQISGSASGTKIRHTAPERIGRVRVAIPAVDEQRRIASILSSYDDLIENNRKRIKLLERAARLLYKEWFVRLRFPGCEGVKVKDGVPEGWETGTIEDFYHTSSGGTPSRSKPEYYEGDINWVKTQELNEDFILETEEKITELAIKNSSAKIYPANTLLVSMYGGTNIGRAALLGVPAACNQACCALLPKVRHASVHHAFLFFGTIREQLIAISQGAAQTNISQQIVKGLSYTLPSESIMQEFSAIAHPFFDQMRTLQAMNRQLTRARDLLLPRLMSGKVTV